MSHNCFWDSYLDSYWPILCLALVTGDSPRILCKKITRPSFLVIFILSTTAFTIFYLTDPAFVFNLQCYFNSTHAVSHRFIQSLLEKVVSVPRIRSPSSDMMDLTVMRKNIFLGLGMTMMITVMAGRASMRIPWTDRGLVTNRPVLSKQNRPYATCTSRPKRN